MGSRAKSSKVLKLTCRRVAKRLIMLVPRGIVSTVSKPCNSSKLKNTLVIGAIKV
jgi:hypothetical protein